jgi:hypothetical protein
MAEHDLLWIRRSSYSSKGDSMRRKCDENQIRGMEFQQQERSCLTFSRVKRTPEYALNDFS